MPITTSALNHMINTLKGASVIDDYHLVLTYTTPNTSFASNAIPSNMLTDLPSASFNTPSGGIRTLDEDVILTANQSDYASYLALYGSDGGVPVIYTLIAYIDITPIELVHSPATLVTVSKDTTYISLANT